MAVLVASLMVAVLVAPMVLASPRPQQNWNVGVDHGRGGGATVHGHAGGNLAPGLRGNVHGQRTFGGPGNGAQSVGGGLNYNRGGLHGGVDATHHRGAGTQYSGQVGGTTRLGGGSLSVGGGVTGGRGVKPQPNIGATYIKRF